MLRSCPERYLGPSIRITSGLKVSVRHYGSSAAIAAEVSLAAAAASTTAQAVSAQQQASYQRAVAQNNQNIANANATLVTEDAEQKAQAKQRATQQLIGRERAAAGASGIDPNTGSPAKIQSDTAELGELDTLTIRNNAAREAWNFRNQAAAFGMEASQATTAGNLETFSSLIGGASSVSGKWSQYKSEGTFS